MVAVAAVEAAGAVAAVEAAGAVAAGAVAAVVVVGCPRQEVERTARFAVQTRLSLSSATTRTLLSSSSVLPSPSSV